MFASIVIILTMLAITWFASFPKTRAERLTGIIATTTVFILIVLLFPQMLADLCSTYLKFVEHK